MSTDIFGIRVLGVDLVRREVELRVFVVHYDVRNRAYVSPPARDPGFFLGLLWHSGRGEGTVGDAITVDQILDRAWVAEYARWFVEHVERTAVRNDPQTEETWERLDEFYYDRGGNWADEELLAQADYVIRVTDATWIEHLRPGMGWGDGYFPMNADNPRVEDLPHLPDMHHPQVLKPFASEVNAMAFSDDGRFLAAFGYDDELVIYDCADWSEHARVDVEEGDSTWRLAWVPGQHVVVLTGLDALQQEAYDVHTGDPVDVQLELGDRRSRTARHRIEFGNTDGLEFLAVGGDPVHVADLEKIVIEAVTFTGDESRLFVGGVTKDVFVIDTATAEVIDTITDVVAYRIGALAVSPEGDYLVSAGESSFNPWDERGEEICVRRLGDGEIVIHHWPGALVSGLEWSPDGRWLAVSLEHNPSGGELRIVPVGLPAEPPSALAPRIPAPRLEIDRR